MIDELQRGETPKSLFLEDLQKKIRIMNKRLLEEATQKKKLLLIKSEKEQNIKQFQEDESKLSFQIFTQNTKLKRLIEKLSFLSKFNQLMNLIMILMSL